ncbi:MAG: hypothetical protein AB8H79_21985, partial [Myxococcota bacterium]
MGDAARSNPLVRTTDASTTARVSSAFEHALRPIRGRLINRLGGDMPLTVLDCEFVQLGSMSERFKEEQVRFLARCRFSPSGVPLIIGLDIVLLFRLIGRLLGEPVVGAGLAESRPLTAADFRLGKRISGDFVAGIQHAFGQASQQTLVLDEVSDDPVLNLGLPPSTGMYRCTIEVGDPSDPLGRAVIAVPASSVPTLLGASVAPSGPAESAEGMARVLSLPVEAVAELVRVKMPLSKVNSAPGAWAYQTNIGSPTPVIPDYTAQAMFGINMDIIEIDGHSAGGDFVPQPDGEGAPGVNASFDNWLLFVMSVKDGAIGINGSHIASLNGVRPAGAELVGYYAQGSQNIHASLPGTTTVEHTAISLGYTGAAATTPDLDALDYNISLNTVAPANLPPNVLFNNTNEYYFTITPNAVTEWEFRWGVGFPFADYNGQGREARAGDVYRITWDGSGWGPREVYCTDEDLGLMEGEDVDALSVSKNSGVVCFSTPLNANGYPNRDQLLISEANGFFLELTDRNPNAPITTPPTPVG